MPDERSKNPSSKWLRCAHCGQEYDPAELDQLLYHFKIPHKPTLATGIVGHRVEPERPES
jgi:hypothetical protein